jgi:4-amino-4-deoxy-L-arabinose transferase-like glycosyltransferase
MKNSSSFRFRNQIKIYDKKIIILLFSSVLLHFPSIFKHLNDAHGFRQTQTAFTIRSLTENGFNPFNAVLPIFGPESRVPMEFPLYQLFASLISKLFINIDVGSRISSLIIFQISAIILFMIVRKLWNYHTAISTLIFYQFNSFALLWATAVLIDYTAVLLALLAVLFSIKWKESKNNSSIYFCLILITGSLSFLVKVTTTIAWLPVILFLIFIKKQHNIFIKIFYPSFAFVVFFIATFQWTTWSDEVKMNQEWTQGLTSQALQSWNFGTIDQRLNLDWILLVLRHISDATVGNIGLLIILIIFGLSHIRKNLGLFFVTLVIILGPLIFMNLYRHTYYPIAIIPAIAILVGATFRRFSSFWTGRNYQSFFWIAPLAVVFMSYTTPLGISNFYSYLRSTSIPKISSQLLMYTPKDSNVILRCDDDWSSEFLYYANRKGFMVTLPGKIPSKMEWGVTYTYLGFCSEEDVDLTFIPEGIRTQRITELLFSIEKVM